MSVILYTNCLLLIHCFMYFTLLVEVLRCSALVLVLLSITFCPFQICNHLDENEEERAGDYALIVFLMACSY